MAAWFSRNAAGTQYSPSLEAALQRLDKLVNWERMGRTVGLRRAMRVSAQPAALLLQAVGNPEKSFHSVHVTGSKGKGSVSVLVATGLRATGACTGIYGSPHVERVNERIRLQNNDPIGDEELAVALNMALDARDACGDCEATWFDVLSVAGMLAFRAAGVTHGVVEVGMGGRRDSTNVLNAPVTVVTNIALEHQDIIGPSLQDIAYEKAGIFSRGCQPIVGIPENDHLASIFLEEAKAVGARFPIFVPPTPGQRIKSHNVALARCALQAALPSCDPLDLLPDEVIDASLATLPARMERFSMPPGKIVRSGKTNGREWPTSVEILLDGAHVPESVESVLSEAKNDLGHGLVMLLALGSDKNASEICKVILASKPSSVVVTTVQKSERYMTAKHLAATAVSVGITNVKECDRPGAALALALEMAFALETNLIILGSLHLAGVLRPLLNPFRVPFEKTSAPKV